MEYVYKSHPTMYAGVQMRSRLEARWAAFFDMAGWEWEYEPFDLHGWTPDFYVTFPCRHSECSGSHSLLVEIKPHITIKQFEGHMCLKFGFGGVDAGSGGIGNIPADASAAFGYHPSVTYWEMAHGAGGGDECVENWVPNMNELWTLAGNTTQWKPDNVRTTRRKKPRWSYDRRLQYRMDKAGLLEEWLTVLRAQLDCVTDEAKLLALNEVFKVQKKLMAFENHGGKLK